MEKLLIGIIVALAAYVVLRPHLRGQTKRQRDGDSCSTGCSSCGVGCGPPEGSRTPARFLALLLALGTGVGANALDTTEAFDLGFSDVEYYAGLGGLGSRGSTGELSNELVLGFGIVEGLSGHMGACVAADQKYLAGETSFCFGFFGSLLERDHVDVDLLFDVAAAGDGLSMLSLAPALEINYDRDPGRSSWGLYLRSGISAAGQSATSGGEEAPGERLVDVEFNPGAYLRLNARHELLIEYDVAHGVGNRRDPLEDSRGVGLGWNATLSPSIELISQFHRSLPRAGEEATFSLSVGFIATLPAGD